MRTPPQVFADSVACLHVPIKTLVIFLEAKYDLMFAPFKTYYENKSTSKKNSMVRI